MALIYWGEVDAASDTTMAFTVNTPGTSTRDAIIDLIEPIAADIIAGNPTVIAAAEAAVANALEPALQTTGGGRLSNFGAVASDLNALPAMSGWYRSTSAAANIPPVSGASFNVLYLAFTATNGVQIAVQGSGTSSESMWFRSKRSSVWGPWEKLLSTTDLNLRFAAGIETPFTGMPSHDPGVIKGTFDLVRRLWYQDAIGPDGRFLQSTIDDIAVRIGSTSGQVKSAPLALTCAAGGTVVDTAPARTVRYPFQIPVAAQRFRVHFGNRNDRTGTLYPGAVSFTGLWLGEAAYTAGEMNGAMATAPAALEGAFVTPSNGSEWVSPWYDRDVADGVNYLLSAGYTNAGGQTNHAGQGGAFVSTNPADASVLAPALSRVQQAPFDVWIEFEIPDDVPIIAALGDSLTAGTAATLPVHDSWPMPYAAMHKVWPAHFAHHGSDMAGWTSGDDWRWTKYGDIDYDAVIWALGGNDISGGIDLATAQARFAALHPKVVNFLSSRIFLATIMPRNNWSPAIEAIRVAYNEWLFQRPLGAEAVVDFAKSVEASVGVLRADYVSGDGVHLKTIGYAQNALAIPGRLTHR